MKDFLEKIIQEAGVLAEEYYWRGVETKIKTSRLDYVTEADIAVNNFIIEKIQAEYPTHHIHSEETEVDINSGAEYEWVIDPIDGTRSFGSQVPTWCILIAILKNGVTEYGAAYVPIARQLFFAQRGVGAFLNGVRIEVNPYSEVRHLVGTVYVTTEAPRAEPFINFVNHTFDSYAHQWTLGSQYSGLLVANGKANYYLSNCGFDHDYLVPALVCAEAGATVTDVDGNPWQRGRRDLVIANPILHKKILGLF